MEFFSYKLKMNFSPMFVLVILAIFVKHSNTKPDTIELALNINGVLIKAPLDIAKLLIWKSVKLPSDISDKVGVKHVVSTLKFLTPNIVKRQLIRLRKKIPVREWKFELVDYVYTIATGSFGIMAYKSKKVLPQPISNLEQPVRKSDGKVARAFRRSKSTLVRAYRKSGGNVSHAFRRSKSKLVRAYRESKAKGAHVFRKENLRKIFSNSKSKFKNSFKKISIPKGLRDYFSKLTKK